MATMTFRGLKEYELKLSRFGKDIERIAGAAIYQAAGIVADEIKEEIDALPVITGYGTPEHPLPGGVTAAQKAGLRDGMGISPMQNRQGYLNVKIGFDGYNQTKTEKYPEGQPNQLVARGVESGASWKRKRPFVRPAVNQARKRAENAMSETIDKEIGKIMK